MSKCAQNMMGKLFALDVKPRGIAIVCLHPGFMKTSMTEMYADKYDELGAIGPEEAAPGLVKVGLCTYLYGSPSPCYDTWGRQRPSGPLRASCLTLERAMTCGHCLVASK